MKKFWHIFSYEYLRHVRRKRFIFNLLGIPIMLVFIGLIGLVTVAVQYKSTPVGYVDNAGVIVDRNGTFVSDGMFKPVDINPYENESAAQAAINQGVIQGVYILDEDYLETGRVLLIAPKTVSPNAQSDFSNFLTDNLLAGQTQVVRDRLLNGPGVSIVSMDGSRQASSQRILNIVLPIVFGILFIVVVNLTGGYLLQALVEEKENRTMEIIVTSVSPNQLMIGKTLANLCVGLTQLAAWLGFIVIGLVVAQSLSPWVAGQQYELGSMVLIAALILPAFILVAGLMATVGAMVTENREAQQVSGIFTLPLFLPLMLIQPLMTSPNSPLAVGLSLFPLTSPMSLPLRAAFTTVPAWQVIVSLVLIYISAAGALLLAGRAFRLGMLQYGRRLTWREVFQRG